MPRNEKRASFVLSLPQWMRDELTLLVAAQIKIARALQMRLVDSDRQHFGRHELKVQGLDVLAAVRQTLTLAEKLDALSGGTRVLRNNAENIANTLAFNDYCEREQAYQNA